MQTPWDDGTTHLVVSPHELLERLAALVPPPHLHLIRYHGVLAPNAADRAYIVPSAAAARSRGATPSGRCACRLAWAQLLARVFREGLVYMRKKLKQQVDRARRLPPPWDPVLPGTTS